MGNVAFQRPKKIGVSLHVFSCADAVKALEDNVEKNVRVQISAGVGARDLEAIANALQQNTSLKVLYLAKNQIDNVSSLGVALQVNTTLEKLDLHGNLIADATSIFNALEHNAALKELYLYENQIENVSSLRTALRMNSSLKELHLQANHISCVDGLSDGIKHNSTLYCLRLQENQIRDVASLAEAIALNQSLRDLRLYHNPIDLPRCVWRVRPWRRCGPILDLCTATKALKDTRRDYSAFAVTLGIRNKARDRPHASRSGGEGKIGLAHVDGLVISNVLDFLWHSESIESRLCGLVQVMMDNHDTSNIRLHPQIVSGRAPASSFNILEWLMRKKSELEGEAETMEEKPEECPANERRRSLYGV